MTERTLPLLLGVVTFIFFTGELWQSVGRLNSFGYVAVVLLFVHRTERAHPVGPDPMVVTA